MPTIRIKPDENGRIGLAELAHIALGDIEALEVASPNDAATGKAMKVAEARVQVLGKVLQHDKMANYTLSLVVTREPVTEAEATACNVKLSQRDARKEAEAKAEQAERDRNIKLVQDAERAAADRVAQRDAAVLENTIKVLSGLHAK